MGQADEDRDPVPAYLAELREETIRRAWGEETSEEDRRRIAAAAVIFGRQFEERVAEHRADAGEEEMRRLLMDLMNGVIREFSAVEDLSVDEAAAFLGDVGTRDRVLEFSEVLDVYEVSDLSLDDLLQEAVEARGDRAFRARWGPG